jgi:hypothetical protein
VRKKYTTFSNERIVALRSVIKIFPESYDFAARNWISLSHLCKLNILRYVLIQQEFIKCTLFSISFNNAKANTTTWKPNKQIQWQWFIILPQIFYSVVSEYMYQNSCRAYSKYIILYNTQKLHVKVTVCQLTPDLPKVRTFVSHLLKDARKLFPWDGWIFCPYEIHQKLQKKSHKHVRFGNVSTIWSTWEKFSHSLFPLGFLPNSESENFSQMDQIGETFPNRTCLWDIFSHMGKIIL